MRPVNVKGQPVKLVKKFRVLTKRRLNTNPKIPNTHPKIKNKNKEGKGGEESIFIGIASS